MLHLGEEKIKLNIYPREIRSVNYTSSENGIERKKQQIPCVTYVGYADGDEKNELRLMITDNKIRGFIRYNGELLYISQLGYFGISDTTKELMVIYRAKDVLDKDNFCGVSELQEQKFLSENIKDKATTNVYSNVVGCGKKLELATDADYEFYQRYGSGANDEILGIINMIEGLYISTFNMNISVVHQNVWTSASDPYTGNPSTDTGSELLVNELRGYWENNKGSVQRDLVHLFTGRDYNQGGVAGRVYEIGSVCKARDKSYGFTKDRVNQFLTTAHEIGHNLGGVHEDGVNCGTYDASIMCQGPKSIPMYFSNASIGRISSFMNANSSCMRVYDILGPSSFCSEATYSIPNLPAGATVSWSLTGSINISGSNNANLATVTKNSNGVGVLTANISTACGNVLVNKNVVAGSIVPSIIGPMSLCLNTWGNVYAVEDVPTATNYQWRIERVNGTSPVHTIMGNGGHMITLSVGNKGVFILYLSITTPCGILETNFFITVSDSCDNFEAISVYPNPANNELRIIRERLVNEDNSNNTMPLNAPGFLVMLLNKKGKVLKRSLINTNNKEIVLQVADIPNGIYYLHIYEGKNVSKQQVVISH